jgi:hypothetical protein
LLSQEGSSQNLKLIDFGLSGTIKNSLNQTGEES